jgi:ketosteroid isomerase-like protein
MKAIEVQEEMWAAFGAGDADRLFELFDESCIIREAPGLPIAGTYVGRGGAAEMMGKLSARYEVESAVIEVFEVSDSVVITHSQMTFTERATGNIVEMPVLEILRTKDGRLVEAQPFYWDTHAFHPSASSDD